MSVPNERTRATGVPSTSAGKITQDGKRIFRMTPPLVIWWLWVGLVVFSVADLLIQGHRLVPLGYAFGGLALTGVVFACTAWPRVIADEAGIRVLNPFRVFTIPWGAVHGIYLADSVEVQCARRPPRKDKTVYSWALSSPRRARARAHLRAWQWDQGKRNRPAGYNQLPQSAQSLVKMTTAEIMARELAALSDEARFKSVVEDVDIDVDSIRQDDVGGRRDTASRDTVRAAGSADSPASSAVPADQVSSPAEMVSSTWAWPPVLAILVPAVGLIITLVAR
ncbi:MAG TPA: PH domain-containing protein [Streptosporangiaceae bacterium]|nr:PH domain-containing protein [Streptosporangiaceae bacterium]